MPSSDRNSQNTSNSRQDFDYPRTDHLYKKKMMLSHTDQAPKFARKALLPKSTALCTPQSRTKKTKRPRCPKVGLDNLHLKSGVQQQKVTTENSEDRFSVESVNGDFCLKKKKTSFLPPQSLHPGFSQGVLMIRLPHVLVVLKWFCAAPFFSDGFLYSQELFGVAFIVPSLSVHFFTKAILLFKGLHVLRFF